MAEQTVLMGPEVVGVYDLGRRDFSLALDYFTQIIISRILFG